MASLAFLIALWDKAGPLIEKFQEHPKKIILIFALVYLSILLYVLSVALGICAL